MPIDVFDYRKDVRNLVITPRIRGRFLRMEPGDVQPRHSHDLADEVFLILEGRCEFEIEGERAVLGAGQLCFAAANQIHQVRLVGDEPMTMYLSVTPHLEPTHTFWDEFGNKLAPCYGSSRGAGRAAGTEAGEPIAELIRRHAAVSQAVAQAAAENADAQQRLAARLHEALDTGDGAATKATLDAMSAQLSHSYLSLREMEKNWNELAARVVEEAERRSSEASCPRERSGESVPAGATDDR